MRSLEDSAAGGGGDSSLPHHFWGRGEAGRWEGGNQVQAGWGWGEPGSGRLGLAGLLGYAGQASPSSAVCTFFLVLLKCWNGMCP